MKHSLLVVDDEPGIVETVYHMLRLDYDVYTATSAAEAFEVMSAHEIHIVMTDQRMPFMTGVELLAKIKGKYPDAIRILFTGFADIDAVIAAINQGNVFRYLAKPWNMDELPQAIAAAAAEYERIVARKELAEKLRTVAVAFGNEAFVTPSLISAIADVLGKACAACLAGEGREAARRCVCTISAESERLMKLVASALDIIMREEPPLEIPLKDVPLRELLEPLQQQLAPITAARRITLRVEGDLSLVLHANRELVRAILLTLLSNAIRFSPDGTTVELRAARQDDMVRLEVLDNGIGIPDADLPHIFEPFFTSQNETRPFSASWEFGNRGIGLGLTIVKRLVDLLHGSVELKNREGGGTIAAVLLPAAGAQQAR
ncbi:MAG TPA: hybrid sensor histidine kinase/response regulator [Planctomycetota bacterium]|nr:hybrid sensor histidine kinase/response regulator [Planctomycetota bacterium]